MKYRIGLYFTNGQYHEYIGSKNNFIDDLKYMPNLYYKVEIHADNGEILNGVEE